MSISWLKSKAVELWKLFSKWAEWSSLKKLQNDRLVKATYIWLVIVPVVTKLLSKLDETIILTLCKENLTFVLKLPFSWVVLYLSALLFVLASALFTVFAPRIVKENDDYGDFRRMAKVRDHLVGYMSSVVRNECFKKFGSSNDISNIYRIFEVDIMLSVKMSFSEHLAKEKDLLSEVFWFIFFRRNIEKPWLRFPILTILSLSGLLLFYVMLQNIWYVASYIFT